jgi:hypothetical protein
MSFVSGDEKHTIARASENERGDVAFNVRAVGG